MTDKNKNLLQEVQSDYICSFYSHIPVIRLCMSKRFSMNPRMLIISGKGCCKLAKGKH